MMASSECSSGCQSGWTTYLDDDDHSSSSRSCGTGKAAARHQPYYYCYSEEDDQSMISDASSGPLRQQCSAGNDAVVEGDAAGNAAGRRGRRAVDGARRQSKKVAEAALLEDTASSPAFFSHSKSTSLSGEVNGYGDAGDEWMLEIGDAADFSYAFSSTTTTGFQSPLNGTALDGYLQMQYAPAAAKPTMPTRQVCRDVGETKRW